MNSKRCYQIDLISPTSLSYGKIFRHRYPSVSMKNDPNFTRRNILFCSVFLDFLHQSQTKPISKNILMWYLKACHTSRLVKMLEFFAVDQVSERDLLSLKLGHEEKDLGQEQVFGHLLFE